MKQLEQLVREEVDSWNVRLLNRNGREVHYNDMVKPILCGVSLGVVEKLIEFIKNKGISQYKKDYLAFTYKEAISEFSKDLVLWHLIKYDKDIMKTGAKLFRSESEKYKHQSYHQSINQTLKRRGLTIKNIDLSKADTYFIDTSFPDSAYAELRSYAAAEISRYHVFFPNSLLGKMILTYTGKIAKSLVRIAQDETQIKNSISIEKTLEPYLDLYCKEAKKLFRLNYLTEQLVRYNFNVSEASKAAGISPVSYHSCLKNVGLSVSKLKTVNPPLKL